MWKIAVLFLAVVGVVVALIFLLTTGEEDRIRVLYARMLAAAEKHDAEALCSMVSESYQDSEGLKHAQITEKIRRHVRPEVYRKVLERDDPVITVLGDSASLEAHVSIVGSVYPYPIPLEVRMELSKEAGEWKVTTVNVAGK